MTSILVEVSAGELIDKITILEIKAAHISAPDKLANIRTELDTLIAARDQALGSPPGLAALGATLKDINQTLWEVEDAIRDCERRGDFGDAFIALARRVYHTNDRRAAVKRQINDLLGSRLIEEKSYAAY